MIDALSGDGPALGARPATGDQRAAAATYPATARDRDRWVRSRRGARPAHDPWRHQGVLVEPERSAAGIVETTATIFLTGRECPWHCVMCDLWRYTIVEHTPPGALPAQVAAAMATLAGHAERPAVIKLYNAGSFFDPRAVPPDDYGAIVGLLSGASRVIVESHPALIGDRTWRLDEILRGRQMRLEVAVGLETAHPGALAAINKRVTTTDVRAAAAALQAHHVDLRVFLLIHPPFVPPDEQDAWLARSVTFALDIGATAVTLIPTRHGEGAMQSLSEQGAFTALRLIDVEHGLAIGREAAGAGRLFVDTWNIESLVDCDECGPARLERLRRHNLDQQLAAPVACRACAASSPS